MHLLAQVPIQHCSSAPKLDLFRPVIAKLANTDLLALDDALQAYGPDDAQSPAYVFDFLATSDGLALTKAFMRIQNAKLRAT